jgi:hypothetical protein
MSRKAGFFSLIRYPAAIAKNVKTRVASILSLGSLAPPPRLMDC